MNSDLKELAKAIRIHALKMVYSAKSSHIGSALSMTDILAVLYGKHLNVRPSTLKDMDRDRFILSKGHAVSSLYGTLAECGFINKDILKTYSQDGSFLTGHASHKVPGIELSTGSLGHGLPVGVGMALQGMREKRPFRVYVLMGDGEVDEGSVWEAALFAGCHKLRNLTLFIDYNKIQSFGTVKEVLDLDPLRDKWESFGWNVIEANGHNIDELDQVLNSIKTSSIEKPTVVLAHTIKGKGVSFMEDKLAWHYKSPNEKELEQAIMEIQNS